MADPKVQFQKVTGYWAHIAEDGVVDDDPYPDLARPDGIVRFEPYLGSSPVIAAGSGYAVTVGTVRATVSDGVLRDLQDRDGVFLAAYIDGAPVWWTAHYDNLEYKGVRVPSRSVVFGPNPAGVNITTLIDPGDIDPDDIPSYQSAGQSAAIAAVRAEEAMGYRDQAEDSAGAADSSAQSAQSSATASQNSATASAASATSALNSASASAASATSGQNSATASQNSAAAAAASAAQAAEVVASGLQNGSVTTPKIADSAVTTPKLADSSITAAKLAAGVAVPPSRTITAGGGLVGGGDLTANRSLAVAFGTAAGTAAQGNDSRLSDTRVPTDNTVTTAKIADSAVTNPKLANNAVTDANVAANAAIAVSKLGVGRVSGSNNGTATSLTLWIGTQAQYDAIPTKDNSTVYVVT